MKKIDAVIKQKLHDLRQQARQQQRLINEQRQQFKEQERQEETQRYREKTLSLLSEHIGETNAVGMAELYEAVYDRPWSNRINDTRALRKVVTDLRAVGVPICSVASSISGGYYLAAAGSELKSYLRRSEKRALLILMRNSRIKKISLPEYLGQMKLNMEGSHDEAA